MTTVVKIQKKSREVIWIERQQYKGHDLINLRVWFDDGSGEYRPGKQGVAFKAALLPDVLQALSSLSPKLGEDV